MRVWLIKIGEPLPTDGAEVRLLRMGQLARQLAASGHHVTWWSCTFNHAQKRQRFGADTLVRISDGLRLVLLHSPGYRRNISLARWVDQRVLARRLARRFNDEAPPDLVVCAFPVPDLCAAAVRFGQEHQVPVVLDIRDLWPDVHVEVFPRRLRGLGRLLVAPMRWQVRRAMRRATALTATGPAYLEWGLRHAGRPAGPFDAHIPMAYTRREPEPEEAERARRFWREVHGLGPDTDGLLCCFIGALSHQFDFDTVLAAARRLNEARRAVRFVFCGAGDLQQRLQAEAADLDNVVMAGWVGYSEIWTLMQLAQVGLAPYKNVAHFTASLPNKPIEYMSGGLVLVSSLRGLVEEMITRHDLGLLYDGAAELEAVLSRLCDEPAEVARMGGNSRRLFEQEYVAEQVYGRMVAHLEAVAAGRC